MSWCQTSLLSPPLLPLFTPIRQFHNFLNQTGSPIFDTLPTNFTVNITDSDLLEACNVTNPGRCESAYAHITLRKGAGVVMTASLAVLVASVLSALTVH